MHSVGLYRKMAKQFVEGRATGLTGEADRYLEKGQLTDHRGEMMAVEWLAQFSKLTTDLKAKTGAELRLKLMIIAYRYYDEYTARSDKLRPIDRDSAINLNTVAMEARFVGDTMREMAGSMLK